MKRGRGATMTHDYKRHGTTTLFAALDVKAGTVIDLAFRGSGYSYRVEVPGVPEPVKAEVAAERGPALEVGSEVRVGWDAASCGLLRRES